MAASYKFEIYKDKSGEFRFRFRAPNGEKMFASEGYSNKASAKSTIKSIVKHVAEAHGGEVSAWSEPGEGSTFTITLPAAHETETP